MAPEYYYDLISAPCRGPMLVARALGVPLTLKPMSIVAKDTLKPEFLALNPHHTVPTLVDGDFVLWESKAIIGYLVGQYAQDSPLYPRDPKRRAQIDRLLYFDMALHQRFRGYAHPVIKEGKTPEPAKLEVLHEGLALLDAELAKTGAFVLGDQPCVADYTLACAVATYRAMDLGVTSERQPHVAAWLALCAARFDGWADVCEAGAKGMADKFRPLFQKK